MSGKQDGRKKKELPQRMQRGRRGNGESAIEARAGDDADIEEGFLTPQTAFGMTGYRC